MERADSESRDAVLVRFHFGTTLVSAVLCGDQTGPIGVQIKHLKKLRDVPTWIFHGAEDPISPLKDPDLIVSALRSA